MNQAYPPKNAQKQEGNAIWFVLLAIALLAALTLAITHFSNTTEQTGNAELENIHASQILRIAKDWDQGVSQMQTREISVNDISFGSAGLSGYANPHCATRSCLLFASSGGGQIYSAPDTSWLDSNNSASPYYGQWIFTGKTCVQGVGDVNESATVSCGGDGDSGNEDLVALLPYVKESLCAELNILLGINNPGGMPPVNGGNIWDSSPEYLGAFADGVGIGASNADLFRKPSGCIGGAGTPPTGTYTFYHVLLPR
jgi:hypothetical protein